ncbi:hypothetical protein EJ357_07500 [Streptomyces cyaneochromogenes]|uniref:Uncharacterized protein n=1 Tax=Streptomyces cyaneochromogenes TaxID=2496836 RepID=A0A3Q9ELS0_9ACTN|nr:hypothetical protein EJ357_07500 [Streptomyces cyaneochromogenes]
MPPWRPVPDGPVTLEAAIRTDRPLSPTGQDAPGVRPAGPTRSPSRSTALRGVYVTEASAAFDWFEYDPEEPPGP